MCDEQPYSTLLASLRRSIGTFERTSLLHDLLAGQAVERARYSKERERARCRRALGARPVRGVSAEAGIAFTVLVKHDPAIPPRLCTTSANNGLNNMEMPCIHAVSSPQETAAFFAQHDLAEELSGHSRILETTNTATTPLTEGRTRATASPITRQTAGDYTKHRQAGTDELGSLTLSPRRHHEPRMVRGSPHCCTMGTGASFPARCP